jgi:hypothetical protein
MLTTDGSGQTSWQNTANSLAGLQDVSLTNLQPDDILSYNLPLNQWFNAPRPSILENSGKYSQAVIISVFGNENEKSVIEPVGAQGSPVIPANSLQDADIFRIKAVCAFENDAKNDGYVVRIKVGGTTIATSPQTTMSATTLTRSCEISAQMKFFSTGSIFNTQLDCSYVDNNDQKEAEKIINVVAPGIDPTIDNNIDITVEWNDVSILKRLFVRQLTIEKLIV